MAGVIDCDGAIWIGADKSRNRKHPLYTLRISVSNTRPKLLHFFAEQFGGRVLRYEKKSDKWRNEYRWAKSGTPAADVIRHCLPYLVIKREQALIALEFASTILEGSNRHIPDSYRELRERLYHQMLELNKKGPA